MYHTRVESDIIQSRPVNEEKERKKKGKEEKQITITKKLSALFNKFLIDAMYLKISLIH